MTSETVIRPYRPEDYDALGKICILTGDSGVDATGKFFDDELLPMIYAYPYAEYAPELARIVERDGEVVGYLIGVADVRAFAKWWQEEWTPKFRQRFPFDPKWTDAEQALVAKGLDPQQALVGPHTDEYPAELHIDLLPVTQGQGLGRRLIEDYRADLAKRGVKKLSLGVGARNQGAVGFYRRLGSETLAEHKSADGEVTGYTMWIATEDDSE